MTSQPKGLTPQLSVAPMLDWTDRHYRHFVRLIAPKCRLYSEMIVAEAILRGSPERLLSYSPVEHPLALQLGGSNPGRLAQAARIGEDFGYDEINLNVGCPSERVQNATFGACLMAAPERVAEGVAAMQAVVRVPVTVKCRIGIDDQDQYDFLLRFIDAVAATGCTQFIVHARKAILTGLTPRQNRDIPPLRYDVVYRLKSERPQLNVVINGGIRTVEEAHAHVQQVDGVMIGREAYHNPYILAELEAARVPVRGEDPPRGRGHPRLRRNGIGCRCAAAFDEPASARSVRPPPWGEVVPAGIVGVCDPARRRF